jgi:hypothetical protein
MLGDDEDVFDSVTWESPAAPTYETTPSGPGFRQDTAEGSEPGPHEPKWEGYLITSVQDPMKELAETKDAYVSYLVSAKVSAQYLFFNSLSQLNVRHRPIYRFSRRPTHHQGGDSRILYF